MFVDGAVSTLLSVSLAILQAFEPELLKLEDDVDIVMYLDEQMSMMFDFTQQLKPFLVEIDEVDVQVKRSIIISRIDGTPW